MSGYTYTTIVNVPGGHTRVQAAFHLDGRALVSLYPAGKTRPFLDLSLGDTAVSIGPRADGPITEADLAVFRDLAAKAAGLLAEVERLHAAQSTQDAA